MWSPPFRTPPIRTLSDRIVQVTILRGDPEQLVELGDPPASAGADRGDAGSFGKGRGGIHRAGRVGLAGGDSAGRGLVGHRTGAAQRGHGRRGAGRHPARGGGTCVTAGRWRIAPRRWGDPGPTRGGGAPRHRSLAAGLAARGAASRGANCSRFRGCRWHRRQFGSGSRARPVSAASSSAWMACRPAASGAAQPARQLLRGLALSAAQVSGMPLPRPSRF